MKILTIRVGGAWRRRRRGEGGDGGVEEESCGATIGRLQSATGCSPVKTSEAEEQHGAWKCEDAQRLRHGGREATPAVSV